MKSDKNCPNQKVPTKSLHFSAQFLSLDGSAIGKTAHVAAWGEFHVTDQSGACNPRVSGSFSSRVDMGLTWIAIAASLLMGGGALLIFIWAVKSHQFKSFEDVKYQVFWSDSGVPAATRAPQARKRTNEEQRNGSGNKSS
jgi:cbb3-type cytochrome oxidase maturation protein